MFSYTAANNEKITGQSVTSDRIELTSNKGNRYVWTRLSAHSKPPTTNEYARRLQGRWFSSSGTVIDITPQNGKFLVNATRSGGQRWTGEGRWLDATSFRYGIQGFSDEWVGTFLSDGRVTLLLSLAAM